MSAWQGRQVYDHLRQVQARNVLELGTAHGVSAAYMAAAVRANGGGTVTTLDRYHFAHPAPEEVLARAGVSDQVQLVRVEESSYCWWLKELIAERSQGSGACKPAFDFCYIDGAHDWHIQDDVWGWARKGSEVPRRQVVETTVRRQSITGKRARMALARLRHLRR
jgi:predicted O-methyltransferase YrrM